MLLIRILSLLLVALPLPVAAATAIYTVDLEPSGDNCTSEGWTTVSGGSPDCGCTTGNCALSGNESLDLQSGDRVAARNVFSALSSGFIYLDIEMVADVTSSGGAEIFQFLDNASEAGPDLQQTTTPGLQCQPHVEEPASPSPSSAIDISLDTKYCVRMSYDMDNDDCTVWVDTPASDTTDGPSSATDNCGSGDFGRGVIGSASANGTDQANFTEIDGFDIRAGAGGKRWQVDGFGICSGAPIAGDRCGGFNAAVSPNFTSGMVPAAIIFDATATTHNDGDISEDTSGEFHDLDYSWDFDDPTAGTWGFGATPDASKNEASGPVAAHVYETAGTFDPVLTVTDALGYTATWTTEITVNTQAADCGTTFCYANSDFTGCPGGATQRTTSDFDAELSGDIGNNTCHYFRAGDTFSQGSTITWTNTGPGIIGAFGTGAKPIVNTTADGTALNQVGSNDWRVEGLDFNNTSGGQPIFIGGSCTSPVVRFLMLDVESDDYGHFWDGVCQNNSAVNTDIVLQDIEMSNQGGPTSAHWQLHYDAERTAVMAVRFVDQDSNGEGNHRFQHIHTGVISHNEYAPIHSSWDALSIRSCNGGVSWCTNDTQYVVISHNISRNGTTSVHFTSQPPSGNATDIFDVIWDGNLFVSDGTSSTTSANQRGLRMDDCRRCTLRNNMINCDNEAATKDGCELGFHGADGDVGDTFIYHNTVYMSDNTNQTVEPWGASRGTGHLCRNNLVYHDNGNPDVSTSCAGTSSNNLANDDSTPCTPAADEFCGDPFVAAAGARDTPGEFAPASAGTVTGGTDPVDGGFDFQSALDGEFVADDALMTARGAAAYDVGAVEVQPATGTPGGTIGGGIQVSLVEPLLDGDGTALTDLSSCMLFDQLGNSMIFPATAPGGGGTFGPFPLTDLVGSGIFGDVDLSWVCTDTTGNIGDTVSATATIPLPPPPPDILGPGPGQIIITSL